MAVCALILSSVVKLVKSNVKRGWHWPLAAAAFLAVRFGLSPVWVVAATAVLGVLLGRKVNLHA